VIDIKFIKKDLFAVAGGVVAAIAVWILVIKGGTA